MYSNIDTLPLGKTLQIKQDSGRKKKKQKKKSMTNTLREKGYKY